MNNIFSQSYNNGKTFENYMCDFIRLLEICGAKKLANIQPIDFHFKINNTEFFFECKTFDGFDKSNPNYSLEWAADNKNPVYKHQIEKLAELAKLQNSVAWLVIYSPSWELKKYSSPFHYINGKTAFKLAFSAAPQKIHLEKNNGEAKIFSPIELLQECPHFHEIFHNFIPLDVPFFSHDFPNIWDYQDLQYSLFHFSPDEKFEIKGWRYNSKNGNKKLWITYKRNERSRLHNLPVFDETGKIWNSNINPDILKNFLHGEER